MIVGSHVSTRRGYKEAARTAVALGGNALQYFPKNPRALGLKEFDRKEAESCAAWCREHGIVSIAHGPYGVNPAAEDELASRTSAVTLNDLDIAEACGSLGVVVHFGVYKGNDVLTGYRHVIQWINKTTAGWNSQAKVLLENMAGDHGPFGVAPEELAQIRSLCDEPQKIGFCLDTCHLFASGVWTGDEGWSVFEERAEKAGFFEALTAIHLNDSRYPSGSRKDRHAALGEGQIGMKGFRAMLSSPFIRAVPMLLETPASADDGHRGQIELAKRWWEEAGNR